MLSSLNRLNIHELKRRYDEVPKQHPFDRLEPLRNSETKRKKTFDSWPKDALIGCDDLIEDGFYYLGVSDKVQCAYCGGIFSDWKSGDSVHDEHKRHFSKCPKVWDDIMSDDESDLETDDRGYFDESDKQDYAQQDSHVHQPHNFGCQNEQKDLVEKSKPVPNFHNPKFSLYNQRLESYVNWPSDHHLKPDELASAGLYYKGSGDKCQCFLCGGILEAWKEGDIAKEEHKKWFPKCYNSMDNEYIGGSQMSYGWSSDELGTTGSKRTKMSHHNISITSWDINDSLAADFDSSLSGLGNDLGSDTYNMRSDENDNKEYIQGQDLEDETINKEFKLGAGSYKSNVLEKDVSKYTCGFLNSSQRGTLYIGVDDYGKVIGTQCDHATRDRIRMDIDRAMRTITPNVFPQSYHVDFIPVYHKGSALKDLYVIEITVEKLGILTQLYETDGKVYIYRDGSIRGPLKPSEIQEWTRHAKQTVMSKQTQNVNQRMFEPIQSTPILTDDLIPTEIKLLSNKKYVPVYLKLLESGSEKKRDIRLVIVGKKGTGKTSLLRRLFREEITSGEVTSTNGIEIHRIKCEANSDDGIWKKLDGNNEETELHARLLKQYEKSLISQVKDPIKVSAGAAAAHKFSHDNSQATSFVEGQVVDESQVTPSVTTTSHGLHLKLSSEQAFRDIEIMLKSDVDLQDKEDYATLFLWDFAGDEEFYHTHQTFLSPNAIYLVVTKLNEADDKDAQDLFRLWMNSIHCYSRLEEDKNKSDDIMRESDDLDPPVVIVGTWKDAVYSESEEIEDVCSGNILMYTENMAEDERGHIRNAFFISNTEDDNSVFHKIRQDILRLARSMRTWNKDYPLKFIQLEKLLQKKKKELPIITLQELKHISTEPTHPLKDEELMLYLKYHHEIKDLVYFEDLPDYIILDTQWLSDAFKCIVTAKKFRNVSIKNQKRWEEFHCKGKLHREVIEEMFKKEQNILYKHKDHILKVMEKFDIIIRPTISNTAVPGEKQCYYVPCMIKAEPEYDIYQLFNVTENTCQKSTWLCFKFKFLPPYLMNHLIAALCREYEVAEVATTEQKRQIALFRGSAVFELQKTTKLRKLLVMKGLNIIQIQVLQFGKQIERGLYNYIANFVTEEIIKIIDTRFKMSNVKFEKKWECSLTKPESVTGSNEFSEEQIEIYYCDICRTTHTFTDEWSDPQRQKLSLPQIPFEDVPETDPKTETRKSQTFSTKVHLNLQSGMEAFSSVSEGPNRTGSSTGFTKEEFNFAKMGMIVLNVLANALYDLLKQDKPNICARSDCDITYLYSEHRKLNKHVPSNSNHRRCPPGPWGGSWQDKQVTDIAIGDDIERIRLTRNELQHSRTFRLDDKRFNDLCNIVTDLLKRFDQYSKPARLYIDHLSEILAKTISEEEVKIVHQRIENEIKSALAIEVEIEHQVHV